MVGCVQLRVAKLLSYEISKMVGFQSQSFFFSL